MKHLLFILMLVIFSCQPPKKKDLETSEAEVVPDTAEVITEEPIEELNTRADTLFMDSIKATLRGIEKHFVRDNYLGLLALMNHRPDSVAAKKLERILSKSEVYPYRSFVTVLDARAGYMEHESASIEGFYSTTYWNVSDGSQLIANTTKSCGPICESEISFTRYKDGEYAEVENVAIIAEIDSLMSLQLQEVNGMSEPFEYEFKLPRKGKDINYCLGDDCIVLKWKDGTFEVVR